MPWTWLGAIAGVVFVALVVRALLTRPAPPPKLRTPTDERREIEAAESGQPQAQRSRHRRSSRRNDSFEAAMRMRPEPLYRVIVPQGAPSEPPGEPGPAEEAGGEAISEAGSDPSGSPAETAPSESLADSSAEDTGADIAGGADATTA